MVLKYCVFDFFENKEKAIIYRMEQSILFNQGFIFFFLVGFCSFLKGPSIPVHL